MYYVSQEFGPDLKTLAVLIKIEVRAHTQASSESVFLLMAVLVLFFIFIFLILNNASYEWIMDLHSAKFMTGEKTGLFGSHLVEILLREEDEKR